MKNNTLAIALAALLVGGVAVAAFQNSRDTSLNTTADTSLAAGDVAAEDGSIPDGGRVQYAQVIKVDPITEKQQLYAQVIGTEPVRETSTTSTPREVCNDVVVQERLPERDGNVGGTVAGAVIGGLIGNQVGGGKGKTLATVAGAVGGGYAGNRIQASRQHAQVSSSVERKCETVNNTSTKIVGYDVRYEYNGVTRTVRMDHDPGDRVQVQEGVTAVSDAH